MSLEHLRHQQPDLEALLTEAALIDDHEVATLDGGGACLAAPKDGLQRLAGGQSI